MDVITYSCWDYSYSTLAKDRAVANRQGPGAGIYRNAVAEVYNANIRGSPG